MLATFSIRVVGKIVNTVTTINSRAYANILRQSSGPISTVILGGHQGGIAVNFRRYYSARSLVRIALKRTFSLGHDERLDWLWSASQRHRTERA